MELRLFLYKKDFAILPGRGSLFQNDFVVVVGKGLKPLFYEDLQTILVYQEEAVSVNGVDRVCEVFRDGISAPGMSRGAVWPMMQFFVSTAK
jgi:hypothetical protein